MRKSGTPTFAEMLSSLRCSFLKGLSNQFDANDRDYHYITKTRPRGAQYREFRYYYIVYITKEQLRVLLESQKLNTK